MAARGVLIQCIPHCKQEKSVCSGVLFSDKWVLTLGSLLDFGPNKAHAHTIDKGSEELRILGTPVPDIHIIPSQSVINKHNFAVVVENVSSNSPQDGSSGPAQSCPYRWHDAQLVAMWRCPILSSAIHTVLNDWQLTPPEEDGSTDEQTTREDSKLLLTSFLLLRINSLDDGDISLTALDAKNVVMRLFQQIEIPKRGQEVVVESTLFGREFFLNSLSQGIISNKLGQRGCLLLTDARAGLGCEGGPIFTNTSERSLEHSSTSFRILIRKSVLESPPKSQSFACILEAIFKGQARGLLGLVLSSLSWWKGEWVGFTLGLALHPVLAHLCLGGHESKMTLNRALSTSNLDALDRSVLLVRCGQSWGTGVVVDACTGLVLTCSHVVKNKERDVSVVWRGRKLSATLVYRTRDGVAYDLALLRLAAPPPDLCQTSMAQTSPIKGDTVYVVGYPMFSERSSSQPLPTVTRGIVSHVASSVMLQTTCCVQSGASGAPVFRADGVLLAVVSCNARDIESGALFPHVNMAVPVEAFRTPLLQFIASRDVAVLSKLEEQDELVQKMWRLNFTSSSL